MKDVPSRLTFSPAPTAGCVCWAIRAFQTTPARTPTAVATSVGTRPPEWIPQPESLQRAGKKHRPEQPRKDQHEGTEDERQIPQQERVRLQPEHTDPDQRHDPQHGSDENLKRRTRD